LKAVAVGVVAAAIALFWSNETNPATGSQTKPPHPFTSSETVVKKHDG
jgi:hypothetical protein